MTRQKAVTVAFAYGATDKSGLDASDRILAGMEGAGISVDSQVINWALRGIDEREQARKLLLEDRFGATDLEAQTLLRQGVRTAMRSRWGPLGSILAMWLTRRDLLAVYRETVRSVNPVLRDVLYYVKNAKVIMEVTNKELDRCMQESEGRPVIAIGVSLGGIILVDALSRRKSRGHGELPALLVTVGSQAPILLGYDALDALRPTRTAEPFTPWLNIWKRTDLLSFPARPVFPIRDQLRLKDVVLSDASPFPVVHSEYFKDDRVYVEIKMMIEALQLDQPSDWWPDDEEWNWGSQRAASASDWQGSSEASGWGGDS